MSFPLLNRDISSADTEQVPPATIEESTEERPGVFQQTMTDHSITATIFITFKESLSKQMLNTFLKPGILTIDLNPFTAFTLQNCIIIVSYLEKSWIISQTFNE